MTATDRPKIHPYLKAARDPHQPGLVVVWDPFQRTGNPQQLVLLEFLALQMFDGLRTLREIQTEVMRQAGGQFLSLQSLNVLVQRIDAAGFLDGPVRKPSCLGAYPEKPHELRRFLRGLFMHPNGPGLPRETPPDGSLCAALVPHIDYGRGGLTYAWGFKDVFERSDASLFVIIGTSHYSAHRFTLTRKHFETPLGLAQADQEYIDRLVKHYGDGLFDDEHVAHRPEHSIELEVVFLQYLYENRRPLRIVPLVVGSFGDCVDHGSSPSERNDIARMIEALRRAAAETKEPICYIISGDLAHIGPFFKDPEPVHAQQLDHSKGQDHALLRQAEAVDPEGYFKVIAAEGDNRRICGLPPTYLTLQAAKPRQGKLQHYDQYVAPDGSQSVSFASVSFYK
jgi:MEMO1 family protein